MKLENGRCKQILKQKSAVLENLNEYAISEDRII